MAILIGSMNDDFLKSITAEVADRSSGVEVVGHETATVGVTAAVEGSAAQMVDDHSCSVLDLGDGTAMLQLDVKASWSTILQILKALKVPGADPPRNTHQILAGCRREVPASAGAVH